MRRVLGIRKKEARPIGIIPGITAQSITDDSDDLAGENGLGGILKPRSQVAPDRVFVGEVFSNEGAVHNRNRSGGREIVVLGESSPAQQWDRHRFKIAGHHRVHGAGRKIVGWIGVAGDGEFCPTATAAATGHWMPRGHSDNSRDGRNLSNQLPIERNFRGVRITGLT